MREIFMSGSMTTRYLVAFNDVGGLDLISALGIEVDDALAIAEQVEV